MFFQIAFSVFYGLLVFFTILKLGFRNAGSMDMIGKVSTVIFAFALGGLGAYAGFRGVEEGAKYTILGLFLIYGIGALLLAQVTA